MAFTAKDYSPEDVTDILAGTQKVLDSAWELSLLNKDTAELVGFLIHAIRKEAELVNDAFIKKVASFWSITIASVEAAVLDLLAIHAENAGDSIIDDLVTLEVIFSYY